MTHRAHRKGSVARQVAHAFDNVLVTVTCALLLGAILTVGCGRKTPPMAPELVLPETVEALAATNKDNGVLLSWKRPERYAGGARMRDLAGFRIERAMGEAPFTPFTTLPVTDRDRFRQIKSFNYLDTGVSSGQTYRYRLFSFTLDGYVSAPSNEVAIGRPEPAQQPHTQ